jgi:23S rRNA (cytidine1920-2'-O)/16S rRNA (cytidine1409-2'-O)-methyltransferase
MSAAKKVRIDQLLVQRGIAQSRERAQALILAGNVLVDDQPITKAGTNVPAECVVRVRGGPDHPWVSRGGIKLDHALRAFGVDPTGKTALDVGASTGGFTDVLLTRGAAHVYAVDVGHSQLDWKIRSDARVTVIEKLNVRSLERASLPECPPAFDIIVIDVSFISLDKILPPLMAVSDHRTDWVVLIKPQFEVGREGIGKGGIVISDEIRQSAVARISAFAETLGLKSRGLIESPITGTDGNKEFLAHFVRRMN